MQLLKHDYWTVFGLTRDIREDDCKIRPHLPSRNSDMLRDISLNYTLYVQNTASVRTVAMHCNRSTTWNQTCRR